jgi:DNA repair/transcription protein MET18/MMS19
MSDIQLYLLDVDKNKREASRIAEQSATRKNELRLPSAHLQKLMRI